jgi:hypothetical protein
LLLKQSLKPAEALVFAKRCCGFGLLPPTCSIQKKALAKARLAFLSSFIIHPSAFIHAGKRSASSPITNRSSNGERSSLKEPSPLEPRARKRIVAVARQLAVDLWRIKTGRLNAEELGLIN